MKESGVCPKCSSKDIAKRIPIADMIDALGYVNQRVKVATKPQNSVFKGIESFEVRAYICTNCGFVEHYITNPEALARAVQQAADNRT